MFRHNHNSKLYKYTTEEKRHYKLYKKKKVWVVAGVLLFGPVAFVPTYVNADEINPVEVMTENELEQVPPSNESASTEINEGVDAQATSETNVAKAPVDTTSTGATTPSTTFQTSETSLAEQTSETLQSATPALAAVSDATPSTATANNTLATAATTDEQDYTGEDVIKLQNVTNGSTLGSITTSQADDGSTIYTYHATSTGTSQTRVGMTVTYTGNKGDTFSMVVLPSKGTNNRF
ncbi:MAG: KxYKxGKxW signal peptide domain-containing protein [Lactobacillus sp.]|nr:KxYKxGKxW signal peptide domain-containing protein [Lactobacillus sp.]